MQKSIDANHFKDHLETTQDQMKKLWALFSQIQHNLKQDRPHPSTQQLAEIGNFLTDLWGYDNEEEHEKLVKLLEGAENE